MLKSILYDKKFIANLGCWVRFATNRKTRMGRSPDWARPTSASIHPTLQRRRFVSYGGKHLRPLHAPTAQILRDLSWFAQLQFPHLGLFSITKAYQDKTPVSDQTHLCFVEVPHFYRSIVASWYYGTFILVERDISNAVEVATKSVFDIPELFRRWCLNRSGIDFVFGQGCLLLWTGSTVILWCVKIFY